MRSAEEVVVLSIFLGFIILGGITGNLLVLGALRRQPTLKKPSSMLLANLALCDLCLAAIVQPYQLATMIDSSLIDDSGILCQVGGVLSYPFFIVSLGTMVGMCIDRFYALGKPLLYRIRITFSVALAMVVCPWIYAVAFGLGTGLGVEVLYDPETQDCGLGWKRRHVAFTVFFFLFHAGVPFVALLVSSILIFYHVKSHQRELSKFQMQSRARSWGKPEQVNTGDLGQRRCQKAPERKLSLMMNSILAVFIMCWSPYLLTRLLDTFIDIQLPSFVQAGSVWILHANVMVNPILYIHFRRNLKNAVVKMFRSVLCQDRRPRDRRESICSGAYTVT